MVLEGYCMNKHIKTTYYRTLFVPILTSFVLFVLIGYGVIQGIQEHFYNHMQDLSMNLASGYSYSIEKVIVSEKIIEQLIEDKLITASRILGTSTQLKNQALLTSYLSALRVDQINLFSAEGELLLTTLDSNLKWVAYEGHPVLMFIQSGEQSMVESIRKNSVTGIRYKYGYYRLDSGEVLQIGILAQRIEDIVGDVNPQRALNEIMLTQSNILMTCYISLGHENVMCAHQNDKSMAIQHSSKEITSEQQIVGYIDPNNSSVFILHVPVKVHNEQSGTLLIHYHMKEQNDALRQLINLGISIVVMVYALLAYVFILNAHKNRDVSNLAYLDPLTNLPNSSLLGKIYQRFQQYGTNRKFLALVNVNEFKSINVTYGYHEGDNVLKELSQRLKEIVTRNITLFRLEGDRFVFLMDGIKNDEDIKKIISKILSRFDADVQVDKIRKKVSARVGLVQIDEALSLSQAIQQSMITLAYEKTIENPVIMFDEKIEQSMIRELKIVDELQEILDGVDQHRLYLMFQPQLCTNSRKILSVEALARLNTHHYGAVGPAEFIALAEKHHLIYALGQLILEKAVKVLKQLNELDFGLVRIAVNVSGIQLLHDNFVSNLFYMLDLHEVHGKQLEIEITESVLMHDMERINQTLTQLKSRGILVSIDDFGTGYSSFFSLSELSVDIVKINRSFVRQIHNKEVGSSKIIAREIIQMAHKLNLKIVAEEVEHEDEFLYLLNNHCDFIQGYYICRPLLPYDLFHFIKQTNQEA